MDAGVQVEALVHGGVGDARGRLGKLVLGAPALYDGVSTGGSASASSGPWR